MVTGQFVCPFQPVWLLYRQVIQQMVDSPNIHRIHIEIDQYQFLWSTYVSDQHSNFTLYHKSESYHHQCLKESLYLKMFSGLSILVLISSPRMYLCTQMSVNTKSKPSFPITGKLEKLLSPNAKNPACIENFKRIFRLFIFIFIFILLPVWFYWWFTASPQNSK